MDSSVSKEGGLHACALGGHSHSAFSPPQPLHTIHDNYNDCHHQIARLQQSVKDLKLIVTDLHFIVKQQRVDLDATKNLLAKANVQPAEDQTQSTKMSFQTTVICQIESRLRDHETRIQLCESRDTTAEAAAAAVVVARSNTSSENQSEQRQETSSRSVSDPWQTPALPRCRNAKSRNSICSSRNDSCSTQENSLVYNSRANAAATESERYFTKKFDNLTVAVDQQLQQTNPIDSTIPMLPLAKVDDNPKNRDTIPDRFTINDTQTTLSGITEYSSPSDEDDNESLDSFIDKGPERPFPRKRSSTRKHFRTKPKDIFLKHNNNNNNRHQDCSFPRRIVRAVANSNHRPSARPRSNTKKSKSSPLFENVFCSSGNLDSLPDLLRFKIEPLGFGPAERRRHQKRISPRIDDDPNDDLPPFEAIDVRVTHRDKKRATKSFRNPVSILKTLFPETA